MGNLSSETSVGVTDSGLVLLQIIGERIGEKQTYNIVQTDLSKKSGASLLLLLVILLDQEEIN